MCKGDMRAMSLSIFCRLLRFYDVQNWNRRHEPLNSVVFLCGQYVCLAVFCIEEFEKTEDVHLMVSKFLGFFGYAETVKGVAVFWVFKFLGNSVIQSLDSESTQ